MSKVPICGRCGLGSGAQAKIYLSADIQKHSLFENLHLLLHNSFSNRSLI